VKRRRAALAAAVVVAALAVSALAARRDPKRMIAATRTGVVMVLAADLVGDRLRVRAVGSGTVISPDGAILTAAHVLDDEASARAHDLFVVGRYRSESAEPELVCAGLPAAAKRLPAVDLALIACDRDLDGRPWSGPRWPTATIGRSESVTPGAQIWVLGYGGLGGARLQASAGLVSGWSGERGGASRRDFMRTDATVAPGSSGGAAVDEDGYLIGVATAYRQLTATRGDVKVPLGQVGLIRPIELARDLVAVAQAGFTPRRDDPTPAAGGTPVEGAPDAVLIRGQLLDAASLRPVVGAIVTIARSGRASHNQEEVARAVSDGDGVFLSDRPVPRGGPYDVVIAAGGFRPLGATGELTVAPDAPPVFEPWPVLRLQRDPTPR
jgi:S1-C subfamily serine protease